VNPDHLMSGSPLSHLGYRGDDGEGNGGIGRNDVTDSEDSHTYHNHYVTHRSRRGDHRRGYDSYHHHGDHHGSHRRGHSHATHSHTVLGTPSCYLLDDILDKQFTLIYTSKLTIYFETECKKVCH
jgi:hypothetical protein